MSNSSMLANHANALDALTTPPINKGRAVELFMLAANEGHVDSNYQLNLLYNDHADKTWDRSIGMSWLERMADRHADSMYNLGMCLKNGSGIARDMSRAVTLFKRAADLRHAGAMFEYARCAETGVGMAVNMPLAVQYYTDVTRWQSRSSCTEAWYRLGRCYDIGFGVKRNGAEARRCYQVAGEKRHVKAMYHLAISLERSAGDNKNVVMYWLEVAANLGHRESQYEFARRCDASARAGTSHTSSAANMISNYTRAAEQGHVKAAEKLARCYRDGVGVPADTEEAKRWCWRAAVRGSTRAMCSLARSISSTPNATVQEKLDVPRLYARAAELGDAEAQYQFAVYIRDTYKHENGVANAIMWLRASAAQRHRGAIEALGLLGQQEPQVEIHEDN